MASTPCCPTLRGVPGRSFAFELSGAFEVGGSGLFSSCFVTAVSDLCSTASGDTNGITGSDFFSSIFSRIDFGSSITGSGFT